MPKNVEIGGLAAAVMEQLEEYADLTTECIKKAVTEAGKTVRKEIKASPKVPVRSVWTSRPLPTRSPRALLPISSCWRNTSASVER